MNRHNAIRLLVPGFLLLGFTAGYAQTDEQVSDQADVWAQIERQWNSVENEDAKWVDQMLTDDFSGWGKESPAPRTRASTKMWTRFNNENSKMVAHELYPLSIVVHNDMAVAHYLFTRATRQKTKDAKTETSNGRYTDVLVRTDDGWKFIAWSGGSDD
ncbi:MAG: nuclear transport factor 2 family protein [Woeseiaceae bacterium]